MTPEAVVPLVSDSKSQSRPSTYIPLTAVILALGANAVWMFLLGYGLFSLIEMAI
jgi:hypothetical protein